jgi:hypothetical protein
MIIRMPPFVPRDLPSLERMADLLAGRVGSLLSLQSLRKDLEVILQRLSCFLYIGGSGIFNDDLSDS